MKTSHTEIMNTLVGLCKPQPHDLDGKVPWEPVRDKMLELYESAVDHQDFYHAFRLVIDAGGHDSPHMADLHEFTKVYVNPKLRKMRFEAYALVAAYPLQYPRIKNACLKWAWKQFPMRGWCPLPPNIGHRFASLPAGMPSLMRDIEGAFCYLGKVASTVVEKTDPKKRIKWTSEVEICIVTKIFAVPKKLEGGKTLEEQEKQLQDDCAELMARKLVQLMPNAPIPHQPPNGNSLLTAVLTKFGNPNALDPDKAQAQKSSTVVEDLVPRVIKLDHNGAPITSQEVASPQNVLDVETIPYARWHSTQAKARMMSFAKNLAACSALILNQDVPNHPVAMIRKGHKVIVKTTREIERGDLKVPFIFKKVENLVVVTADEQGLRLHPHSVPMEVSWPLTTAEKDCGMEQDTHNFHVSAQPEFNLPKASPNNGPLEWSLIHSAPHLFWGIKRQDRADELWNCELKMRDTVPVFAVPPTREFWPTNPLTETFTVRVPYIVNTVRIPPDTEVILKWQVLVKAKPAKRDRTWVDRVRTEEGKRHEKGKGQIRD